MQQKKKLLQSHLRILKKKKEIPSNHPENPRRISDESQKRNFCWFAFSTSFKWILAESGIFEKDLATLPRDSALNDSALNDLAKSLSLRNPEGIHYRILKDSIHQEFNSKNPKNLWVGRPKNSYRWLRWFHGRSPFKHVVVTFK